MILLEDFILKAIKESELSCSEWLEIEQKRLADEVTVAVIAYLMHGRGPPPEGK